MDLFSLRWNYLSYKHLKPTLTNFSWTIAIKTLGIPNESDKSNTSSKTSGYTGESYDEKEDLSLLMEEAKTMMKVGEYHENIVNLQGMTARLGDGIISQVIGLVFLWCPLYSNTLNTTI